MVEERAQLGQELAEVRGELELFTLLVRLFSFSVTEGPGLQAQVPHGSVGGALKLKPGPLACEVDSTH